MSAGSDAEKVDQALRPLLFLVDDRIGRLNGIENLEAAKLRREVSHLERTTLDWSVAFLCGALLLALAAGGSSLAVTAGPR
ncbi:MAG TPA: hypothetical protein VFR85_15475 [Anaeromyxobacteraceae bacterium]|nr:hypothetical protein [Anaeromyxobacteraceae bacterium]